MQTTETSILFHKVFLNIAICFQRGFVAQFIHLTDSRKVSRITKSGILTTKIRRATEVGLYCTPVSMDFYRTHQWLRELKRTGVKSMHAIQFYLSSETLVKIGRYNGDHIEITASEAINIFEEHTDGLGLEVIVPHRVAASAIQRVYLPSQTLGWRFHPEAKGKKPFCGCRFCNRGEINAYRVITEERE